MELKPAGSQPSMNGPDEWFTGTVRIDPPQRSAPARPRIVRQRHIRAGRAHRLAYPSARPNAGRDGGMRLDSMRRRTAR
jgi:hypothetical protein